MLGCPSSAWARVRRSCGGRRLSPDCCHRRGRNRSFTTADQATGHPRASRTYSSDGRPGRSENAERRDAGGSLLWLAAPRSTLLAFLTVQWAQQARRENEGGEEA